MTVARKVGTVYTSGFELAGKSLMRYFAALCVLFAALQAGAQQEVSTAPTVAPWYLGVHAGLASLDDDADAVDDGGFLRGTIGRQVSDAWTLELEVDSGSFDTEFDNAVPAAMDFGDIDQTTAAINFLVVNREPRWNPYFLVGLGGFSHDSDLFDDTGAMAQVAVGGSWDLNNLGLMLRVDLRYRYLDLDQPFIDEGQAQLSVGLEFPFGR